MKRRSFIGASAGTAALALSGAGETFAQAGSKNAVPDGKIAGYTLAELVKLYRYDLFDDYQPFADKFVVDHELGGFMCNTDRDGRNITGNKKTWYLGRGIWAYSHLYNNFGKDPKYLAIARKAVEFTMAGKPSGNELWPESFSREGKPLGKDRIFYGDMFIAEGLQEYSLASGEDKWMKEAKDIMYKCIDMYDNKPDYGNLPDTPEGKGIERPRLLGHWFVQLDNATQMLEKKADPDLEAITKRCVDAVMNYHYNPAYDLINENLNHDLTRNNGPHGNVLVGHAPETLWFIMAEAVRIKDKDLFILAANRLKRHIEVLWDDVYGGYLLGLDDIDKNKWNTTKALWLQEEILIGTIMVIEYLGEEWAREWFGKTYSYVRDKFVLKQYGYPLWISYGDRKVTFVKEADRIENYHHPRHLMKNILALERIMKRGGKISPVFA